MHRQKSRCVMVVLMLASWVILAISAAAQDGTIPQAEPAAAVAPQAEAATFDAPAATASAPQKTSYFGPFSLNWTTKVKESDMFRVTKPSPRIYSTSSSINGFANVNQDEGDLNFHRGLVMDRSDFLTEMDVNFGEDFGFRASAAAWWDPIYNQRTNYLNSPDGAATYPGLTGSIGYCNAASGDCAHFAGGTKEQEFLNAELMDAFVHARFPIGSTSVVIKAGQFAQQWGETLFFGGNGIAGAMSPVDVEKLMMVPNLEFKEAIRPVPQVALDISLNSKVMLSAYYQLRWEEDRLPAVGSYFSSGDVAGAGAQRWALPNLVPAASLPYGNLGGVPGMAPPYPGAPFLVPQGFGWFRQLPEVRAKNWGQFGVALKYAAPHGYDLGLYIVQFHEKGPQFNVFPSWQAAPVAPGGVANGIIGAYTALYQQNIQTVGLGITKTVTTSTTRLKFPVAGARI